MKHLIFLLLAATIFSGCEKDEDDNRTPTKILITKITVTRFPQLNSGASWDVFDGADIFPVIGAWSGASQAAENATSSNQYNFIASPSIEISNLTGIQLIELYDSDGVSANDFMGSASFQPSSKINGKPESFVVDGGGAVAFTLFVDYVY